MPAYDSDGFAPPAPVARVLIRHPDTGQTVADVRMVIDTGADVTLLPRSVVAALGLVPTGARYELAAFDGTLTEGAAVSAVLILLNKSFRGQYLPVESDVGVLGRNVLNCVRLLLDGPTLNWEEEPTGTRS